MVGDILGSLFGRSSSELDIHAPFIELGADSLFLLQFSQAINDKFKVKVPFRLLLEELSTIKTLAAHLEQKVPQIIAAVQPLPPAITVSQTALEPFKEGTLAAETEAVISRAASAQASARATENRDSELHLLFAQQLKILARQLDLLRQEERGADSELLPVERHHPSPLEVSAAPAKSEAQISRQQIEPETFVPFHPINKRPDGVLTERQRRHLDSLIARVCRRTPGSRSLTQTYRPYLADSRVISGFRPLWKGMVYPLITKRAHGSRIWDVDDNEYLDLTMGFGSLLFGHSPTFITDALQTQLASGMQIGGHSHLGGKVAQLICEMTGVERVSFCNSGTEAVMTALRIARAVTGRTRIAVFEGCYHGTFDGVLVRGINAPDGQLRAAPMAPGVPPRMIEDVLMLKYNDPESLALLKAHGSELAAVLIEPPRSRRPDVQPRAFLHELRRLTEASGTALIFDEVVTGFRFHPGGVQAMFEVKADLVTYGKAIGGGVPVAVVAGRAAFMDAIDGGMWQYGDESYPEANVTFFTGTYFKHPLIMSALWASLNYIKDNSPQLQEQLNEKAEVISQSLNTYFQQARMPLRVAHFGSMFRIFHGVELKFADLLYYHLLEKGVYICETRSCFLSTAHTDEDVEYFIRAVKESAEELRDGEFLPEVMTVNRPVEEPANETPRVPLTESQKQVWAASQMGEEAARAYNLSWTLRFRGALDATAMRKAVQEVINRHDGLRATFGRRGDYQEIAPSLRVDVPLVDLSHLEGNEAHEEVARWQESEAQQSFDLAHGPLMSVCLLKLSNDDFRLILTFHHLIADGWSLSIIMEELSEIYSAERQGRAYQLPAPRPFSQYACVLANELQSDEFLADEQYWLSQFADPLPSLQLPSKRQRPQLQTYAGAQQRMRVEASVASGLKLFSVRHGCTLFMTLLAAFKTLLYHVTDQSDIVVGTPSAGQVAPEGGYLVGHCANLLPLRSQLAGDYPFITYLASVKRILSDAYEHQKYPYGRLVKNLTWLRNPAHSPLVAAVFNLDRSHPPQKFFDLEVEVDTTHSRTAKFDITLDVMETDAGLILDCEYNTDLFDGRKTRMWMEHYEIILRQVIERPNISIDELRGILRAAERQHEANTRQESKQARVQKFHVARRTSMPVQ